MGLGFALVTLGGIWWGYFVWRDRARQRLVRTGLTRPGTVVELSTVSNEYHWGRWATVQYEGPDGSTRQARVQLLPVEAAALHEEGGVVVLVDPARPDRAIIDRAALPAPDTLRARVARSRIGTLVEQNYFMTFVCTSALVSGVIRLVGGG